MRATSEPPPEWEDQPDVNQRALALNSNVPLQEYSWEWGAFPQPSPMTTTFGKSRKFERGLANSFNVKARSRLPVLDSRGEAGEEEPKAHRSRSVPPELEGSPTMKRRELTMFNDDYSAPDFQRPGQDIYGAGGRLTASRTEPMRFIICIEDRKVGFQLSLIPSDDASNTLVDEAIYQRGRRNSSGSMRKAFHGHDEVEAARIFDKNGVTFDRFLEDESIVKDERLVIRWAGNQYEMLLSCIFGTEDNLYNRYIARTDGSPLMEALVLWRDAAIKGRIDGLPSRPSSDGEDTKGKDTFNDQLSSDERGDERSTLHVPERTSRKPTSSSWVRWWRRGQAKDADIQANRQNLGGMPTDSAEVFTAAI